MTGKHMVLRSSGWDPSHGRATLARVCKVVGVKGKRLLVKVRRVGGWARFARATWVDASEAVREATPREVELGYPVSV